MAYGLLPHQIQLLTDQFGYFDTDGDGKLTIDDTAAIMRSFNQEPTEEEIAAKHKEFDPNGKGFIELDDFLRVMGKSLPTEGIDDEEIMQIFTIMDQNMDGFLTKEELCEGLFGRLGPDPSEDDRLREEEIGEMVALYDKDGDGRLDVEEFGTLMRDEIYGSGLVQAPPP